MNFRAPAITPIVHRAVPANPAPIPTNTDRPEFSCATVETLVTLVLLSSVTGVGEVGVSEVVGL